MSVTEENKLLYKLSVLFTIIPYVYIGFVMVAGLLSNCVSVGTSIFDIALVIEPFVSCAFGVLGFWFGAKANNMLLLAFNTITAIGGMVDLLFLYFSLF